MSTPNPVMMAAIGYVQRGLPIVPVCWPNPDGKCGCPGHHVSEKEIGKAPWVTGFDDLRLDERAVVRWWTEFPRANIGLLLDPAGLADVAPDSETRLAQFKQQGLPRTPHFASGGGVGHEHFLYRRPQNFPRTRLCRSGEYDILSLGMAIMPPSKHRSGRSYHWLVTPDEQPFEIVPLWVKEMMVGVVAQREHRREVIEQAITTSEDEPPVRLSGNALERWYGRLQRAGDRSGSLDDIGHDLAYANATYLVIFAALRDRDAALFGKYTSRRDQDVRYAELAERALSHVAGPLVKSVPSDSRVNGTPHASEGVEDDTPTPASARKKDAPTLVNAGTRLTDLGNAERLAAAHGADLHYVEAWKTWLAWDGRRWQRDETGHVMQRAKATVRAMYAEAATLDDAGRTALASHAVRSESEPKLRAMVTLAKSDPSIAAVPKIFDSDPWSLNVSNGTVDLRRGTLRVAAREDLLTLLVPVSYTPTATAPRFQRFLREVFKNNAEVIHFVHLAVGYSLTGNVREQVFFVCHGTGSNGKSTFLKCLRMVVGDYAHNLPFSGLDKESRTLNDLADIEGKRLITASESDEHTRLNEARLKMLTGGDPVTGRQLYQRSVEFEETGHLWLSTNFRPVVRDDSHAFWRRVKLIPFEARFDPKAEPTLDDTLKSEAEGILAWAVAGAQAWFENGLPTDPEVVAKATATYRQDSDHLLSFLESECVLLPEACVEAAEFYRAYERWATHEALSEKERLTRTTFGRRMANKFERSDGRSNRAYHGVGLATNP